MQKKKKKHKKIVGQESAKTKPRSNILIAALDKVTTHFHASFYQEMPGKTAEPKVNYHGDKILDKQTCYFADLRDNCECIQVCVHLGYQVC